MRVELLRHCEKFEIEMMMWRRDAHSERQKEQVVRAVVTSTSVDLQYIMVLSTFWTSFVDG